MLEDFLKYRTIDPDSHIFTRCVGGCYTRPDGANLPSVRAHSPPGMAGKAKKFRTLGRNENRIGRVKVEFEFDRRTSILTVHLLQASGLVFPTDNLTSMGVTRNLFLHARVQILPTGNASKIGASLFGMEPPKQSPYRRLSQIHRETACPIFREVWCVCCVCRCPCSVEL